MEPSLTLEDYQIAKEVLLRIFRSYLSPELRDSTLYEQSCICEAMRQVDIDMYQLFGFGEWVDEDE